MLNRSGLITILLAVVSLAACQKSDPEQRLRTDLDRLEQAVEEKQRDTIHEMLSTDFMASSNEGTVNIQALMLYYFRQNSTIMVFRTNEQLTMYPQAADVVSDVLITGSASWIPERGRRLQVSMRWKQVDEQWKLARIRWQPVEE